MKASVAEIAAGPAPGPHALMFSPRAPLRSSASHDPGGATEGREVQFPARAMIFQEGDLASCLFQVDHGTVMLYQLLPDGRRQVVEFLQAGDVFGFSAAAVRDCSAEALVATSCTAFDRSAVAHSPVLTQRLSASVFSQLSRLHEHVMLLGRK